MALNSQRTGGIVAYLALLFVVGTVCRVEAHNEDQTALAIPLADITIDGKLDDWPEEMAVYPIEWESPIHYRPGSPDGPVDFSGSFRVGYNLKENLLYLAIVVQDEDVVVHPERPDFFNQDLCEVYVDADHSGGDLSGGYSTTARRTQQYAMVAGESKLMSSVDGNPALVSGDTKQSGVQAAFLHLAGFLVYEWAIPIFESFPDRRLEIQPGRTIGFDVALVDADGLESGDWFAWTPEAGKVSSSSLMGDVTFVESYQGLELPLGQVSPLDYADLGAIVGRVVERDRGEPIQGARVEFLQGGEVAFAVHTDSAGGFRQSVPGGIYAPRGFSRGVRDTVFHEEIEVTEGEETVVDLDLEDLGTLFHVNDDALEGGDGSAGDPFRTISEALAATSEGDTVQVAAGVYREPVKLLNGVTLLGAGADSTFLDGEGKRGVVQITSVKNVVLEGFAVVNGRGRGVMQASMAGDNQPSFAGILIGEAGNVRVAHNLISGNINTQYSGGGISCYGADSTVVIAHNAIVGNSAQRRQWGGGGGGGIFLTGSRAVVRHNTVVFNGAVGEGGGILCEGASPLIHDNIIVHNLNGGVAFKAVGYRSAEDTGPGPQLARNDVWNNTGYDYLGLEPGADDFSVDPGFLKVGTGDFRLSANSPLRGAGSGGDVGADADLLKQGKRGLKVVESVGQGLKRLGKKRSPAVSPVVRKVEYLSVPVPQPVKMRIDTIQVGVEPLDMASPDRREKLYDRSAGLPSNQVRDVAPAPDGSIWVGTNRGAARFDGLWTYWDTLAGLPGNEVEKILPVRDGSVWIATRRGLAHLREGRMQTVSQESFSKMIEGADRGIWGESYGQLAHLDSGWTYFAFADSTGRPARPIPLFAEKGGGVWGLVEGNFGPSGDSAALRYNTPEDLEAYVLPEDIDTYYVQARPASGGRFWIVLPERLQLENRSWPVMRSVGLMDPDAASLKVYRLPEEWQYNAYNASILVDDADALWIFGMHISSSGGVSSSAVLKFDGESWRGAKEVEFAQGRVALDAEGNFWLGHYNRGLTRYGVGTWTAYEGEERLEGKAVNCIVEDRDGSLWFGGEEGLVRRSSDGTWSRSAGIDTTMIDLLVDRQGGILAGTARGVHRYDGQQWASYAARGGLIDTAVTALAEGADGRVWAGTSEGLFRYDGEEWESSPMSAWKPGGTWRNPNSITGLYADSEGRMWIGTQGGLYVFNGEKVMDYLGYFYPDREVDLDAFSGPEEPEEIQRLLKETLEEELDLAWFITRVNPDINFSQPDSNRQRVVGAYNQLLRKDADFRGLARRTIEDGYAVQTMFSGYEVEAEPEWRALSALGGERIAAIFPDRTGNLWFAAGWENGLFERRDEKWIYHQQSALPFDGNIRNTLTDRAGNLWLATDQGAVRYDGEEWVIFGAADGLPDNAVADIFEDRQGDIWFATGKGVTRYRPDRRVPQTRMVRGPEGTVGYGTTTLTFWFEGGDREWEDRGMTFAHALLPEGGEPGEEAWSAWSEKSFVQVEPPGWGHFIFHVRARDKVLNVDPTPATHAFFIAAPWWRDGRFQAAAGLALLLIILSSSYGVRKQRQAREAERALIRELEEELETAHELQMGLMPKGPPQVEGIDVAGRCVPFNHVGGDFFQYFPVGENRLAISLADVTGHAMEAAVPVMMFSGILKTEMRDRKLLEQLFRNLNETLCDSLDERTFVCFAMGEFDATNLTLKSSNCGCPYPYHYRAASRDIAELQIDAYPLGIRPGTEYRTLEVDLASGDRIVFCSDGIIEAENAEGEMLGYERTAEMIRRGGEEGLGAAQLIDRIFAELGSFAGGTPPGDDQTVVVVAVER